MLGRVLGEEHFEVPGNVIVVRRATVADAEEIGEAHASAWEVAYVDLFEPEVLRRAAATRRTMWGQMLASSDFDFAGLLVAEQSGHVVGFSQFGRAREEPGRGEIFGFYLHPGAWGKGAATELMTASLRGLGGLGFEELIAAVTFAFDAGFGELAQGFEVLV